MLQTPALPVLRRIALSALAPAPAGAPGAGRALPWGGAP